MGVLSGKDVYSSKWITAEITDAAGMIHFVPIKHTIGSYFIAEIDRKVYCFKIDGTRIKTWQKTLAKSFRILQYDISNYNPISAGDMVELEKVLEWNGLPKLNKNLLGILRLAARKENPMENWTPHKLIDIQAQVTEWEGKYPEQARNLIQFIKELNITEIVTPVRRVVDFLEGDLKTTDPGFLGDIFSHFQRLDHEHKKVTNTPVGSKNAWVKILAVVMMIGVVGAIGYLAYDSGIFDDLLPGGLSFVPGQTTSEDIMKDYSSPEELKAAIDRGEVDYDELPKDVQRMVDTIGES